MADNQRVIEFLIRARDQASAGLRGALRTLTDVRVAAVAATAAIGSAIAAAFGGILAKNQLDAAQAMLNLAKATGVAVEDLSALEGIAKRAGIESDFFRDSVKDLTEKIYEAAEGSGEAYEGFAALGIQVTDTQGNLRPTLDVLGDIAERMKQIPDPALQTAVSMQVMGEAGFEMIPLLQGGREELFKMAEEAKRSGKVLTTEAAEGAAEAAEALNRVTGALGGIGRDLAISLGPSITKLAEAFQQKIVPAVVTFGKELSTNLKRGTRDVAEFIAELDVNQVVETLSAIGTGVAKTVGALGGLAKFTIDTFKVVANTLQITFNGLQTIVLGTVTVVLSALKEAAGYAAKFGLVSDQTLAKISAAHADFAQQTADAVTEAERNYNELTTATDGVVTGLLNAGAAALDLGVGAGKAALGIKSTGKAAEETAGDIQKLITMEEAHRKAVELQAKAVAAQIAVYGEFNGTLEDALPYNEALATVFGDIADNANDLDLPLTNASQKITAVGESAEAAAARMGAAFQRAGLETQAALTAQAEAARILLDNTAANAEATVSDLVRAYQDYAEKARAALEFGSEEEIKALDERLEKLAEALDIEKEIAGQRRSANEGIAGEARLLKTITESKQEQASVQEEITERTEETTEATEEAADASQSLTEQTSVLSGAYAQIVGLVWALSRTAGQTFQRMKADQDAVTEAAADFENRLNSVRATLAANRGIVAPLGWGMDTMIDRANNLAREFWEARLAAENMRAEIVEGTSEGTVSLYELRQAANLAESSLRIMDHQQLAGLHQAIDAATAKLQRLREEAAATVNSLRDELDRLEGDTDAIERRAFEKRRAELEGLESAARESGDAQTKRDAAESIQLLEKAHQIRLDQIREEKRERAAAERERAAEETRRPSTTSAAGGGIQDTRTVRLELVGATGAADGLFTEAGAEAFLEQLREAGFNSPAG